jgi:uncharacterized protein (TIGR02466 family)
MTEGFTDLLFPKTLYIKDNAYTGDLYKVSHAFINKYGTHYGGNFNQYHIHTQHDHYDQLHIEPEFQDLCQVILHHAKFYAKKLGYSQPLKFLNMWVNKSHEGDYFFPHTHPGSLISGVFYVRAPPESKIQFMNEDTFHYNHLRTLNEYNKHLAVFDCFPGRLLLFRSDFVHGNTSQPPGEKISISFNIIMI